jgi:hypothetical protein
MRICVDCGEEYAEALNRCIQCGGEIRKRTISEAMIELVDEAERDRNLCPECGTITAFHGRGGECAECVASIARTIDNGHLLLIRP